MHVINWDILDLTQNGFVRHPQPWYGEEEYFDKKKLGQSRRTGGKA